MTLMSAPTFCYSFLPFLSWGQMKLCDSQRVSSCSRELMLRCRASLSQAQCAISVVCSYVSVHAMVF